jgi:plasmid stabilization system protein ParE
MAFPGKGRLGRIEGTRELVVPGTSHIVVYEILEPTVFIIAILHGARRWPSHDFPRSNRARIGPNVDVRMN